ncbi:MAG: hypothetical protein NWE93_14365 [Candidatus Bathyarchaeota archaeon]|nr:hypothetical protein [Candidatus Bathyarchaeota archaeon]
MATSVWVILKKTFSIALIFNSLISIASVAGIIYGYYHAYPYWKPYAPYLLDGNIFWLALAAALINIFPSAAIGRALHTGRFLFHHYVYGFFVLASSSAFVMVFTPIPLLSLFFVDNSTVAVNAGRVFFLGGLALFLDDLPDVSKRVERGLNWLKTQACRAKKALHILQFALGGFALYCSVSIFLSTLENSERALSNSFVIISLFVTAVTSFALVKRKAWLSITPPQTRQTKPYASQSLSR